MPDTLHSRGAPRLGGERRAARSSELVEWLRTGRLTLLDRDRMPVDAEQWPDLPPDAQSRALAEFERVVRGNAKAAVLFLK